MTQPRPQVPIHPYAPQDGYSVPAQAGPPPWYPYGYGPPVPMAPNGAPLAEFWERLVAYLVDSLVMAAIMLIPTAVGAILLFRPFFEEAANASQTGTQPDLSGFFVPYLILLGGVFALQVLIQFCYQVLYQSRRGQTVGKRVMKIRVQRVSGEPLTVGAAALRWLVQGLVPLVVPFFGWLDGLWQLWDKPYRQCLHDKTAKTVVVKGNPV